jgi:hypothetical protein
MPVARTTKEKTPQEPISEKQTRIRKNWNDVQEGGDLHKLVVASIAEDDKRIVFTMELIAKVCSLCKQEKFPIYAIPWGAVLTEDGKLTKLERATLQLFIADWEARVKKSAKQQVEALQLDLQQAMDEIAKLSALIVELENKLKLTETLNNLDKAPVDF